MIDERELIRAAQAGSVAAFTDLVGHYRVRLLRFLVTRSSTLADAEDALQDTLVAAFRYLHSYDSRWRFSTWLYRIAVRNAQKQQVGAVLDASDVLDDSSDPLLHCMRDSESQNLWLNARRILSDDVFAATWLRYAEDLSIRDISQAMDRSPSWTKVNLMRARKALESAMNPEQEEKKAYG